MAPRARKPERNRCHACLACGWYLRLTISPFGAPYVATTCGTSLCYTVRYKQCCSCTAPTSLHASDTPNAQPTMRVICYICSAQLNARQGPHMVAPKTCGNALAASGRLRSLTCLAGHMYCLDCTLGIIRNTLEPRCPVCRQQFRTPGGLIHVHPKFGRDAYHLDLFRNILPRSVAVSASTQSLILMQDR